MSAVFTSTAYPNRVICGPYVVRQEAVDAAAWMRTPGSSARVRPRVCSVDGVACRVYFVTLNAKKPESP